MPKEAVVPDLAAWYQKHGVNALVYDTHGIGSSDGEPRFDVSFQMLCSPVRCSKRVANIELHVDGPPKAC